MVCFNFFKKVSSDKLAFLNNIVGVFESEIGTDGNLTEKAWEWN